MIVDIDANEIAKLDMPDVVPVVADAGRFLERLADRMPEAPDSRFAPRLAFCGDMRERFPLLEEKQDRPLKSMDLYRLVDAVSAEE